MGSLKLFGNDLHVDGTLVRIARLKAEKYDFVDDPKAAVESLRTLGRRIDIFTFFQKLPETAPRVRVSARVGQPGRASAVEL